jgi:hypothetical protein
VLSARFNTGTPGRVTLGDQQSQALKEEVRRTAGPAASAALRVLSPLPQTAVAGQTCREQ